MRTDSFSIRPTSSLVFSSPTTAPCRCNSAKPLIAVNGVRSSWEASATNRRNLFSLLTLAAKDSSMRPNIVFNEVVNRPTSVFGLAAGRRADRSPPAIASAVSSTRSNGLSEIAIIQRETKPTASNAKIPRIKKKNPNLCKVRSTSANEFATTTLPKPVGKT